MTSGDLARIRAFELESIALVADEVIPIPQGWVARAPSLPRVWSLNHVGVTHELATEEATSLADRHPNGLPYRQLVVEHEATGERLEAELPSQGWKVERNVVMALRTGPDRHVDTSPVIEVDERAALQLMTRWTGEEEELRDSPEGHREVVEAVRLTWRARRARRFGVLGVDGAHAGITMLLSDGRIAQVEDVYVAPAERGRGFGRAMVTRAVELAGDSGHDLTFIAGDDNGWPKELYAKIGFQAVARTWLFHR